MSFSSKNYGRAWFILLASVIAVVTALQSVLYLIFYDDSIGLYVQGFPTGALKIAYLLIAVALCLPLIFLKKCAPDCFALKKPLPNTSLTDFFALLTGGTIAATLVIQLINIRGNDPLSILLLNPTNSNTTARTMLIAALVLALPAAFYFIGFFIQKKWGLSLLFTLLWICAYMLCVYFDSSILLMSPTRELTLAALCAIAFFLIAELRLVRGIYSTMMYAVSATLTALFAGASGLGGLMLTFSGSLPYITETAYYAVQLSIALFALFRLGALLMPANTTAKTVVRASEPAETAEEEEA